MVPQQKNLILDPSVIARALSAAVPTLDGCSTANTYWEGQTENDLKIRIEHRSGHHGLSVSWSYLDSIGEGHQHRSYSVTVQSLPVLVAAIVDHARGAIVRRFTADASIAQDPGMLAARARLDNIEDAFHDEPPKAAFSVSSAREADLIERKFGIQPLPEGEAPDDDEDQGVDPALQFAADFRGAATEETPDVDTDVEDEEGAGEPTDISGGGLVPE